MGFSGWLDSSILAGAGIPTVIFGPAGEGLHADSEHVDFASVVTAAQVLAGTVAAFCR
jgi:acetylornithine deacetylase